MKFLLLLMFIVINLNSSTSNTNSSQEELNAYLNRYLYEFQKAGKIKEYNLLKKHSLVDKRYYPTPDPKTWKK